MCSLCKLTCSLILHVLLCNSFVSDLGLEVPYFGRLTVDISYGGTFCVIIPAQSLSLDVKMSSVTELVSAATAIKHAVMNSVKLSHPDSEDLAFSYGVKVILTDGNDMEAKAAHFVVFVDQEVDRSPCGSGTTARVALQYRRQQIAIGQSYGEMLMQSLTCIAFYRR